MPLIVKSVRIEVSLSQLTEDGETDLGDNSDFSTSLSFAQHADYGCSVDLDHATKFLGSIVDKVKV